LIFAVFLRIVDFQFGCKNQSAKRMADKSAKRTSDKSAFVKEIFGGQVRRTDGGQELKMQSAFVP